MRPEDVPEDLVVAAMAAYSDNEWRTSEAAFRAALAAALPLAAAEERAECAKVADAHAASLQSWADASDNPQLAMSYQVRATDCRDVGGLIRSRGEPR